MNHYSRVWLVFGLSSSGSFSKKVKKLHNVALNIFSYIHSLSRCIFVGHREDG